MITSIGLVTICQKYASIIDCSAYAIYVLHSQDFTL